MFYYKDLTIDPDNFEKPATGFRSTTFYMLSPHVYKEGFIFTKHIEVKTDVGLQGESLSSEDYISFKHFFETVITEQECVLF